MKLYNTVKSLILEVASIDSIVDAIKKRDKIVIYYDGETKFTGHGREKRQRRGRTKREGREGEGEKRGERRDQEVGGIE